MAEVVGGALSALSRRFRRHEQSIFVAAAAAIVVVAAVAPLAVLIVTVPSSWTSAVDVLAAPRTWILLLRSLLLAGGVTFLALSIGVPLGLLLGRADVPLRRAIWLAHAFPMFLPPFLSALGWFHWFGAQGFVGTELTARALFSELGVALVLGTTFSPIITSLVVLAVSGVDASLEEAARIVAPPLTVAWRILLPAASPAIALGVVLVYALSLSELGVPMFLRVDVFPAAVFARLGGVDFAPAEAFALTLPLLPVALLLAGLEHRFASRRSFAVLALRSAKKAPLPLGRWRAPAVLVCLLAAALSLAPTASLVIRSGGAEPSEILGWARAAPLNGLIAAASAATVIILISVIAGHGVARGVRAATALDALCMLSFLMPAAVLGVGLIALWNRPSTQLVYGTLAILVVAYVARYAVVVVRAVACAVSQSDVHLEEAAASSGAGYARRLTRIVVPLHARGIAFAWLLALVFCLRDLETAVLFYPPGLEPLTVRIFTLEANGPPAVVAGLAVLHAMITAVVLVTAAFVFRGRRS